VIVHPKLKILSRFTHHDVVQNEDFHAVTVGGAVVSLNLTLLSQPAFIRSQKSVFKNIKLDIFASLFFVHKWKSMVT